MDLVPKIKSETQLTGTDQFDIEKWSMPYASKVKTEFIERYEKLKNEYENLTEEIFWNNIIYEINLSYEPTLGNEHYLYFKNNEYLLSIIGPHEGFNEEYYIGTFKMDHTGKWNKLK